MEQVIWGQTFTRAKWNNHVSHLPQLPELIQQLLPHEQLMMIAGQFGIGKTMELLHLMFCFSYDGKWHGLEVEPNPVLYITWEGDPQKLKLRMDIIEAQYIHLGQKYPWYIRMEPKRIPLNTEEGHKKLAEIVNELNPRPKVVLLDPFKRAVNGNYSNSIIADAWIEGAQTVARDNHFGIITANHTNKITYRHNDPPDALSSDKVKGAGDLLDGVNASILIAEEKGDKRITRSDGFSKVVWTVMGTVIKVLKARDSPADFPLLQVSFSRQSLKLDGQEWVVASNGSITVV